MELNPRNIHVITCGFDHVSTYEGRESLMLFGEAASTMGRQLADTFSAKSRAIIRDEQNMKRVFFRTIDKKAGRMTEDDVMMIFLTLHGNPKYLQFIDRFSIEKMAVSHIYKHKLVNKLSTLPGLKIVFSDSCCSDVFQVPPGMVWIASSKIDQDTYPDLFREKVSRELAQAKTQINPFSSFIANVLNGLHNFPLISGSLNLEQRELQYWHEIEKQKAWKGVTQRIAVRSNGQFQGQQLSVTPHCYFPT